MPVSNPPGVTQTQVNNSVAAHEADTTNVHGIANTADIVLRTTIDLKGDLLVGTADNTLSRLAVGTNGQVLTADSAESTGSKWASVGGGGAPSGPAGGILSGTYPDPGFAVDMATQAELNTHESDTTSVHGITDTSVLATDAEVATAVSDHSADTTSVHGITDTSVLATATSVATAVSNHEADTTSVHGISDTADVVQRTTINAKGDLLAGTADNALARLAVGTNGQALVADSAETTGLKFVAPVPASHSHAQSDVTNLTTDLSNKQSLDTDLTAIAELTSAADKLPYATGAGTWDVATLTATGRSLLDDASVGAVRTTLGLASFTIRTVDTFAVGGIIAVPVGDVDFIPGFFVSLASGQTASIVSCKHRINAGTSVTAKLQKNGSDLTGFTSISVTTTSTLTDPADQAIADGDYIALVVTAVSATPKNMSFTVYTEHTKTF